MRALTDAHLPLLRNILKHSAEALFARYALEPKQLRFFVHYHPSYYHFHVHVVHIHFETGGMSVGKAHLLQDVIDNLELDGAYYQKRQLTFELETNHPVMALLSS